jgi:hypothetical protein
MKKGRILAGTFLLVMVLIPILILSGCSRGGGETASVITTPLQGQIQEVVLQPPPFPPPPVSLESKTGPSRAKSKTAPISTTLPAGWTSLSFPFDSLNSTEGFLYYLYKWNGTQYELVDPRSVISLDTREGYFGYSDYPTTISADGPYSGSIPSVNIRQGWNFFGYPRQIPIKVSKVTIRYQENIRSLAEATSPVSNPQSCGYYRLYTCEGNSWGQLRCDNPENTLDPWKGYWFYSWVDGAVLNLDPVLVLKYITPQVGPISGGTPVTLKGYNFLPGATVSFGGIAATGVTVVNDTTITCTTPPHAAGAVDVILTNPPGVAVTLPGGFTYVSGRSWTWSHPYPTRNRFRGIWGRYPNDIHAVGENGTICHWNGYKWKTRNLPYPWNTTTLYGVWGSDWNNVYAVGAGGTLFHYDGYNWGGMSYPWSTDLYCLWGSGPGDIFAGGTGSYIGHWDGSMWNGMENPNGYTRWGMWGSAWNNIYAVGHCYMGYAAIAWYNGTSWVDVPGVRTIPYPLYGVWGSGSSFYAVGGSGTILHGSGQSWSQWPNPPVWTCLYSIWGSGPSNVFAAGNGGNICQWNGTSWESMSSPTMDSLWGMWGFSGSNVYAVGDNGTIVNYNGSSWLPQSNYLGNYFLFGVWGNSISNIYAVGEAGGIFQYDGSRWNNRSLPYPYNAYDLFGVWGSGPGDIFAVGEQSNIFHYDGAGWSPMPSPPPPSHQLYNVWGSGPSDVYAVGDYGAVCRYNGASWSNEGVPTSETLYGLWGSGSGDVFAVGFNGSIIHYDGNSWSTMDSHTTNYLFGVWGSGPNDVYAVGGPDTILHYDGSGWAPMSCPTSGVYLYGIWGTGPSDVYASGTGGTLLHYDGNGDKVWTTMESPTGLELWRIWGTPSDVFTVGQDGTILRYTSVEPDPTPSPAPTPTPTP